MAEFHLRQYVTYVSIEHEHGFVAPRIGDRAFYLPAVYEMQLATKSLAKYVQFGAEMMMDEPVHGARAAWIRAANEIEAVMGENRPTVLRLPGISEAS